MGKAVMTAYIYMDVHVKDLPRGINSKLACGNCLHFTFNISNPQFQCKKIAHDARWVPPHLKKGLHLP